MSTSSNDTGQHAGFTLEDLDRAMRVIADLRPPSLLENLMPRSLMGMQVYEAPPPRPKMQLSPEVMVSDKFRADINAWLIERFGYEEDIFKDRAYILGGHSIIARRHLLGVTYAT